jgi:hypothetical protein
MAAGLESLYALYNPLWLVGTNGSGTDLFTTVVRHFTSRTTHAITQEGQICSILTKAQNKIFEACRRIYQGQYEYSAFSLCDFFIEAILNPSKNPPQCLSTLFSVLDARNFVCKVHGRQERRNNRRKKNVIIVRRSMFEDNDVVVGNFSQLFCTWTTNGLVSNSGLVCAECKRIADAGRSENIESGSSSPNESNGSRNSSIAITRPTANHNGSYGESLSVNSQLQKIEAKSPPHLYFYTEVGDLVGLNDQLKFLGDIDWPYNLDFGGETYTLNAQGYWNGSHYWCKVIKIWGGTTGVWLHKDQENQGNARLISAEPTRIGGKDPNTSYVLYSRGWTGSEQAVVNVAVTKVKAQYPKWIGASPFYQVSSLDSTNVSNNPVLEENKTDSDDSQDSSKSVDFKQDSTNKSDDFKQDSTNKSLEFNQDSTKLARFQKAPSPVPQIT